MRVARDGRGEDRKELATRREPQRDGDGRLEELLLGPAARAGGAREDAGGAQRFEPLDQLRSPLGLIRFRGQFDYAACLSVNILSNSAGLTIPMAE